MLLATYNHWLKKAYPLKMLALSKLGLRVEFQTVNPNDTLINPSVMLSIVDSKEKALYSWNGEHCVGGVDALKEMATSMWQGMPAMLDMLRARHIYMAIFGVDLPQSCHDDALSYDYPKTPAAWAVGTQIEFKHKNRLELLDGPGLLLLKDKYEQAAQPELNRMVGTRVLVQLTGETPLVATEGALLVTTANLAVDKQAAENDKELRVGVGLDADGMRFKVLDAWMLASYGWENAAVQGVMSWPDLKRIFGVDQVMLQVTYGVNGGEFVAAFLQSMRPGVVAPMFQLPDELGLGDLDGQTASTP